MFVEVIIGLENKHTMKIITPPANDSFYFTVTLALQKITYILENKYTELLYLALFLTWIGAFFMPIGALLLNHGIAFELNHVTIAVLLGALKCSLSDWWWSLSESDLFLGQFLEMEHYFLWSSAPVCPPSCASACLVAGLQHCRMLLFSPLQGSCLVFICFLKKLLKELNFFFF